VRRFGELEAVIMDRLWTRREPATVREIVDELRQHREIAYTTVLTVMDNLYKKGWLRREPAGRAHRYTPAEALLYFVGRMTLDEAAALRRALTTYERKIAGK